MSSSEKVWRFKFEDRLDEELEILKGTGDSATLWCAFATREASYEHARVVNQGDR